MILILAKWALSEFSAQFKKMGWTDPIDWSVMGRAELLQLGLQTGHIVRFKRCLREYKQDNDASQGLKGVIYAIQSVSSGKYLDGRGGESNPLITARKAKGDKYLNWNIIPTNISFALKSVSSGRYLDGRSGAKEPLMTNRDPTNDKYLNWTFEKTNGGPSSVAIKSVSSGKYLDGRNAKHNDPVLTQRIPTNDKYLQWVFIPIA